LQFFSDFKHKFNTDGYFKFRTIAVLTAVFLGFCGLWLGFSLVSAMFGLNFFPAVPGRFFVRSFGILSVLIPVYFFYAAVILADRKWRPDRIFTLSGFIFPFLTLSIGLVFIRDFDLRSGQSAFLDFLGKTGFSLFIITVTVIEVLLLQMLKNMFFKENKIMRRRVNLLSPPAAEQENTNINENMVVPYAENPHTAVSFLEIMPKTRTDSQTEDLEEYEETDIEEPDEDEECKTDENDDDVDAVTRALEEAEAAAAIHAEQMRKKSKQLNNLRNKKYMVPVDILNEYPDGEYWIIDQETRDAAIALKETLNEFKIHAEVTGIRKGPVITMFEILPAPGVKLSKIVGLQDNIALRLAASSVRIVAPIPGKHAVGIEVPNAKRNIVSFKEIIEDELQRTDNKMGIPIVMGKDITGEAQTVDLVQMPHLLIAGATGSGKSVCVNSIILSILYQLHPAECKLLLIDPKIVELKLYNDIPHLLTPVITDSKKAFQALQYCIYEMERRYACLDSMGVRDIRSYNKRIKEKNIAQEYMPYIVVVIDEYADLMTTTGKELESTVARLAAMSRAVGIHLVLATQRPSIDVITGLIKANIPSRIAFMVASKTDSRIIIDMIGAEKLLGKGDMLYSGVVDPFPIRMQGAFISEEEVEAVVEYVKSFGEPDYIDDEIFFEEDDEDTTASLFFDSSDPLYEKALEIVYQMGKASASYIQRRLKIGFNRAARLVDEMEQRGVVGPTNGSKARELIRTISA
jgi:S-DNA-T family DNA segregation ATPase FtsK/SpoIIIE